jgi:hypothetical protein
MNATLNMTKHAKLNNLTHKVDFEFTFVYYFIRHDAS